MPLPNPLPVDNGHRVKHWKAVEAQGKAVLHDRSLTTVEIDPRGHTTAALTFSPGPVVIAVNADVDTVSGRGSECPRHVVEPHGVIQSKPDLLLERVVRPVERPDAAAELDRPAVTGLAVGLD